VAEVVLGSSFVAYDRTRVLAHAARWQGHEPLPPDADALLRRLIEGARPAP